MAISERKLNYRKCENFDQKLFWLVLISKERVIFNNCILRSCPYVSMFMLQWGKSTGTRALSLEPVLSARALKIRRTILQTVIFSESCLSESCLTEASSVISFTKFVSGPWYEKGWDTTVPPWSVTLHLAYSLFTYFRVRLFRICLFRIRLFRVRLFRVRLFSVRLFRVRLFRVRLFRIRLYRVRLFRICLSLE